LDWSGPFNKRAMFGALEVISALSESKSLLSHCMIFEFSWILHSIGLGSSDITKETNPDYSGQISASRQRLESISAKRILEEENEIIEPAYRVSPSFCPHLLPSPDPFPQSIFINDKKISQPAQWLTPYSNRSLDRLLSFQTIGTVSILGNPLAVRAT
jgi:hypothetical protein